MKKIKLIILTAFLTVGVSATTTLTAVDLKLGDNLIRINVYENKAANVTFFAPHHNERTGLILAKDFVNRKGGRLIEIVSSDERGNYLRNLRFAFGGKQYSVDPNRIYTENGRNCNVPFEARATVANFAAELQKILLATDGKTLRANERFIVAVHNNTDVSAKAESAQTSDLTAISFIRQQSTKNLGHGLYEAQADGVFLSNTETDEDNFILLSTPMYIGYFAERGFNVVVQKPQASLVSTKCTVDDGSLSIFSGQNAVPYINLEADGVNGFGRQRQMLDAIYGLLIAPTKTEPVAMN